MLRLLTSRDSPPGDLHERIFVSHYAQVLSWAMHLADGHLQQAEDLVQDAFVCLVNSRPDFSQARNVEAYLYGILRNLRRAQLNRAVRLRSVPLSILDFDSARLGLRVLDYEDLINRQNDLRRICHFACHRKETSKSGSVLILRFFHGYYPSEIAAINRCSRPAVEERLRQARRELQIYLADPSKLEVLGGMRLEPARTKPTAVTTDALLAEISERIFRSASGPCFTQQELRALYRDASGNGPNQAVLAHIVGCHACLDTVNSLLRLVALEDRDPNDSAGNDPGRHSRPASPRRKLLRWKRRAAEVLEHEPKQLIVAVNGQPLGSNMVVAEDSEFAVTIALKEDIEFIEVLSEQQVRLLLLPVFQLPPEGRAVQTAETHLSDGRSLSLRLSFASPWPEVHVAYHDPIVGHSAVEPLPGTGPHFAALPTAKGWFRPVWTTPVLVSLLIVILLFVQTSQTSLSAAVVLDRVAQWERSRESKSATVLHRIFDLRERRSEGTAVHRRVEVWRMREMKVSHLLDESGRTSAIARLSGSLPRLDSSNAWQFEPAADTYRALTRDRDVRVVAARNAVELKSASIDLAIDKSSYRPISETIHIPGVEFEFSEAVTETIPEAGTPLAPPVVRPDPSKAIEPIVGSIPPAPRTTPDLDSVEVAAWVALHSANADLSEEVHVHRREDQIEVSGFVDSATRKEVLNQALAGVPNLKVSLLSPEDLSVANGSSQPAAVPSTATDSRSPLLEKWLEQNHPDPTERNAWITRVVDLSRDCLRRSYALHELASRYPSRENPEIVRIAREHEQQLASSWEQLTGQIGPVIGARAGGNVIAASWHDRVFALFAGMKPFQRHIFTLFTADASEGAMRDSTIELETSRAEQKDLAALIAALSQNP